LEPLQELEQRTAKVAKLLLDGFDRDDDRVRPPLSALPARRWSRDDEGRTDWITVVSRATGRSAGDGPANGKVIAPRQSVRCRECSP